MMTFWVRFESWRASGRPSGSSVVERPSGWNDDPDGRPWEENAHNAVFFGPFSTRREAEVEEARIWDEETWVDAEGFVHWRH